MKPTISFLILFFCIDINIILTTCHSSKTKDKHDEPDKNWFDNYKFTGISKECNWNFTTDFTSNLTRGNTIVIKDPPAHILHPDSFFGYNSEGPTFNYERLECEFDVEAPVDHGLVVSIQQMNFDKECSDFVQLTNRDGSLNETICDKFGEIIPRYYFGGFVSRPEYPGSNYLEELNSKEYPKDSWEESHTEGRISVKISVSKKNLENLRYLFIAFTATKKENYSLPQKYYCDGIKNWKTAEDENECDFKFMEKIIFILIVIIFCSPELFMIYACLTGDTEFIREMSTSPEYVGFTPDFSGF